MKRNKFPLSNYKLLSMPMGKLIPINWFETLPGDTMQQATKLLVRVAPLVAPVMHPVRIRVHHWFVPLRLIWDDFEDFITGGNDGLDSTTPPTINLGTVAEGSLLDYLGIPPAAYGGTIDVSVLAVRAYDLIYNEMYRDQDLITELVINKGNGTDATTETDIQNVSWGKDYFTTARPWAQKGSGVTIPLGAAADVKYYTGLATTGRIRNASDDSLSGATGLSSTSGGGFNTDAYTNPKYYDPNGTLYADLAAATGIDIADLRLALAVQRYQERSARHGSRYSEYLKSAFKVRSSDGRLALPEYLGGGRQVIQFSEVIATAEGTSTDVGDLKGHGIAAMRSNRYRRFFEEHGIVMTLMSVVPKSIYANGIHRSWSRTVKEDYYQKELAMIGEQEILNKEIYSEHSNPEDTFGFQARYDEYRSLPSSIHGEFRSTLNHWHMARIFGSDPTLNQSFIDCVPTDRIYASTATDPLYVLANHSIQARRQMHRYAKTRTF